MTNRTTYESDDANHATLIIDRVPSHLTAEFAPIQFIVTDEVNGPDIIVCINFSASKARKMAQTLLDYAALVEKDGEE